MAPTRAARAPRIAPTHTRGLALGLALGLGAGAALLGCGPSSQTFAEHGAALARDATITQSPYNAFACTTCHGERTGGAEGPIYPGAPLAGATLRPTWWGGNVVDLQVAVDTCWQHFMWGERLDPDSETAQALLAYMAQLSTTATSAERVAVAFTLPPGTDDVAPADAARGASVYTRACATCHGALHTGAGRLGMLPTVLPDDTFSAHLSTYGPACTREIFIEKIRHGSFLGYAGRMPPFSREVLSDAQLADLLAYMGVPSGGTCNQ